MMSKRVLIFAGGEIDPKAVQEIEQDDFIIGADRGALFLVENGIKPHISVGDFDSVNPEEFLRIKEFSEDILSVDAVNKDLTDTELAFDIAIDQQASEIIMIGVTGTRLDHTLSNIQMMLRGLQHQIISKIWDRNNYITLTGSTSIIEDRGYTYVSLLALTPEVTGIHLDGFQYPLVDATLKMGQSIGVSNRLLGSKGTVTIDSGLLLIIQSKD
ncbi:thiamine diphosphokinase [Paenibacillus segetis]|uniref:Thiamine diphosphokinase n=1 Tax=Paenibacillus segetis TaxID=1325360 RepID=A0ABQ1YFM7_9BACL|nr:thiamine diphosphokinase [Paenibacillus segetis]GGH22666.1 thiamine pyrophosphokinase [Paenibacillus segetis]